MIRPNSPGNSSVSAALVAVVLAVVGNAAFAQPAEGWTRLAKAPASKATAERWVRPLRGEMFQLDHAAFRAKAAKARRLDPSLAVTAGLEVALPMPDGSYARFKIVEAPVMEDGLAAKFPGIKTYAGQGIDDPAATVRLDISQLGFHAQILSPNGSVYVDPAYRGDANLHVSYYKRDLLGAADAFECLTKAGKLVGVGIGNGPTASGTANKVQSGTSLRTYRLAVSATAEYTAYHSSPSAANVAAGQAAIVTAINRVNGVFQTELAVRFTLVANNNLLVYTNSVTDPFTNDDGGAMLDENQSTVDSIIGSGNYDIGHVFSTGGGGVALLGCVCQGGFKAQGVTGGPVPTGDAFWIDFVAHEMGHQFGANHTFNSTTGNCSGNRNASTAFEPGSGSTIMAYAGICTTANDLQLHSDAYFHSGSIDEIQAYLNTGGGGSCAVTTSSGNTAPTVSITGPTNYTIPASTPFALTVTATDPNGDPMTYCWEEMDTGSSASLGAADNGNIPLFRSIAPTNTPTRFFPKLSSILANTNWNQEVLPTTSRTMKFRATVRDNRVAGGGVADADMTITSVSGTGPFRVTIPNTATNWSGARTVTWNVAGSSGSPINASGVNIWLSTNGGLVFPFLLVSNAANSGSASVTLPNLNSTQARIKVEGTGNVFFDISDANFTVAPGAAVPVVQLNSTALIAESCTPTNGAVDPYETVTVNFTLANVGGAPTTNLTATLLTSNGVYYPSAAQNYGAIAAGSNVTRSFGFTPSGPCGGSVTCLVQLLDGAADMGTLTKVFALGPLQSTVVTQVFANAGSITIRDTNSAVPYPSTISVSGVSNITKVTATLTGFTHTWPDDAGALLVGPGGAKTALMVFCGGVTPVSGLNLTFDDSAPSALPDSTVITSGSYRPTNYAGSGSFYSPAPTEPYGSSVSALAATPNGTWSLYVGDFSAGDTGSISGGWKVTFITTNAVAACCTTFPAPSFTSTTYSNNAAIFSWSAIPGPHYQVQYTTNLAPISWVNLGSSILASNTLMSITDSVTSSPQRFYRVIVGP